MILKLRTVPNALLAIWRITVALFKSTPLMVKPEVAHLRHSICKSCTEKYLPDTDQCLECTCFCSIKTLYTTESCPLNRW
jgi:hypothetical protein